MKLKINPNTLRENGFGFRTADRAIHKLDLIGLIDVFERNKAPPIIFQGSRD